MERVGNDANSVFHEDMKFFKKDTFESETNCALSKESLLKFLENTQKVFG